MTDLPVGLRAEHTIVHPNANGATIVLGVEPLKIEGPPPNGGQVVVTSRVEWVASIHLPPAALKHLRNQLNAVVDDFERMFGVITLPVPPSTKPTLAAFNPEVVRKTDQPEESQAQEAVAGQPAPHRWPWEPRGALFDSEARPVHRPESTECPPAEPEPSPSEPTP
jgi:Asp-tRNA(Asn)/Glu-tRNA(Gln) amidotransferase C subunit